MKKIYLVRHGESAANVADVIQDANSELSKRGHEQAVVLAKRLQHLPFHNLLVSDYVRARQTVAALLPLTTIVPEYTPLAREIKRPTEFIGEPRHGDAFHSFEAQAAAYASDPMWHFSDEENYYDIVARIKKLLAYIDTLEGDTLVITHGRFIISIMMYVIMKGKLSPEVWLADLATFTQANTGITVLSYKEHKEHWALTTFNDHAHFAE
jgi:broad specificity phosphatase PhoE